MDNDHKIVTTLVEIKTIQETMLSHQEKFDSKIDRFDTRLNKAFIALSEERGDRQKQIDALEKDILNQHKGLLLRIVLILLAPLVPLLYGIYSLVKVGKGG